MIDLLRIRISLKLADGHLVLRRKRLQFLRPVAGDAGQALRHRPVDVINLPDIARNLVDNLIQGEENRHLNQKLHAAACGAGPVFLVDFLHLILLLHEHLVVLRAGPVKVLVFLLNGLKLRRHHRVQFGEFLLTDRKGKHQCLDDDREKNDRDTDVRDPDQVQKFVDPVHQKTEQFCDRPDDEPVALGKR